MSPRPRDFTLGQFKYVSTPPGAPAADADLIRTVRAGLQASAMPYFGDLLSDEELRAVVRTSGPSAARPEPVARFPFRRAAGQRRERRARQGPVRPELRSLSRRRRTRAEPLRDQSAGKSRRATSPRPGRSAAERAAQIWLRLTTGMALSAMPFLRRYAHAAERWDIVNYVLSLARVPPGNLEGTQHLLGPRGRFGAGATPRWPAQSAAAFLATGASYTGPSPASDDCDTYSFFLRGSSEPGCQ